MQIQYLFNILNSSQLLKYIKSDRKQFHSLHYSNASPYTTGQTMYLLISHIIIRTAIANTNGKKTCILFHSKATPSVMYFMKCNHNHIFQYFKYWSSQCAPINRMREWPNLVKLIEGFTYFHISYDAGKHYSASQINPIHLLFVPTT